MSKNILHKHTLKMQKTLQQMLQFSTSNTLTDLHSRLDAPSSSCRLYHKYCKHADTPVENMSGCILAHDS